MKKSIIGQDKALEALARALRITSLKLQSKTRPIGSFLFLGPTGVGKTEAAKVLAINLFGYRDSNKHHPANFLRVDMSEYSEKHGVSKLFGAPPGYIGYDDSSSITDFVSENPNCVLLFDEIDKAHQEVLNSLLHIMDEGEIRTNQGTMVSFEDVIIIMTSNHGAELINKEDIGFGKADATDQSVGKSNMKSAMKSDSSDSSKNDLLKPDSKKDYSNDNFAKSDTAASLLIEKKLINNLKKQLKPEFINRFDEIIVFGQLTREDLLQILNIMIKDLDKNLQKRKIKIKINTKAKEIIVDKAYSKEYGARELKRVFNKEVVESISRLILENIELSQINVSGKGTQVNIKFS